MRVMSYNILCGGQAHVNGTDRLADILTVATSAAPDILALQEANHFDRPEVADRFAKALGLPFHALSVARAYEDGERYHVAVFTRYHIVMDHNFSENRFQSAAQSLMLDTPLGRISLVNLHLHASNEAKRLQEITTVLAYQKQFPCQIVLGDFNAVSRKDPYPPGQSEFEPLTLVTDKMSGRLTDLFGDVPGGPHWTHPSRAVADHDRKVPRRIDYIYASPDLAARAANPSVLRTKATHRASDHFPIIVDFD